MIKIDLITGFLGSGKTTFLKLYARYLINKGLNIGILENDYGAVNVDMMLLKELEGDKCELEMVSGGCHQDCHRRRFKTKLIAMAMDAYDRVIVEPSGIFDVDEFFDALREEPLNRMYEVGNVIAIVDGRLESYLSNESEYYLASEIANSGVIMLSRTQLMSNEQIISVKNHIVDVINKFGIKRDIEGLIRTHIWEEMGEEEYEEILNSGYEIVSFVKRESLEDSGYSSVYFLSLKFTIESINEKIAQVFNNPDCGKVFRVKGFFLDDDIWYEVNATKKDVEIKEIPEGQEVVIVIGEDLNKDKIESIFH